MTVIKVAPDRDCYVIWSEADDAPKAIGAGAEIERYLRETGQWGNSQRLERANVHGSSDKYVIDGLGTPMYGWRHLGLVVRDYRSGEAPTPERWLPRENLEGYTRALFSDDVTMMLALTEPFDD